MPGDSHQETRIASMNYLSVYSRTCQKGALLTALDKALTAVCHRKFNCSET